MIAYFIVVEAQIRYDYYSWYAVNVLAYVVLP